MQDIVGNITVSGNSNYSNTSSATLSAGIFAQSVGGGGGDDQRTSQAAEERGHAFSPGCVGSWSGEGGIALAAQSGRPEADEK